jgi:geranylgeranyl pyrophosphate synthase
MRCVTSTAQEELSDTYANRFAVFLDAINQSLQQVLTPPSGQDTPLWHAMRHGVLNGGKRIRSVLLLETCRACGGDFDHALPVATALELIHSYSLIHDDLPCMDDDDLRRGHHAVHKAFSESLAVLAGDALLPLAFACITDHITGASAETRLHILSRLSQAAGPLGLVAGQACDMQAPPSEQAHDHAPMLWQIHHGKTAALFRFAAWAGGRMAEASPIILEHLGTYGEQLGIAFQMVDDLLDLRPETARILGKTPGKDAMQGKLTFPAVYGVSGAQAQLDAQMAHLEDTLKHLKNAGVQTDYLVWLARFVQQREY